MNIKKTSFFIIVHRGAKQLQLPRTCKGSAAPRLDAFRWGAAELLPFFYTVILLILLLFLSATTFAAEKTGSIPIKIEADRMESVQPDNKVLFSGNVEAQQGELIIHSEQLTIYYMDTEENAEVSEEKPNKIKKLFAVGSVKIKSEGWRASGDNMEFFEQQRKVLLTGNAKAWQGNNMVAGNKITLYLDSGKTIVERGDKKGTRVKALFYQDE